MASSNKDPLAAQKALALAGAQKPGIGAQDKLNRASMGTAAPSTAKKAEEMKKAAIAAASRGPAPSKNTSAERPVKAVQPTQAKGGTYQPPKQPMTNKIGSGLAASQNQKVKDQLGKLGFRSDVVNKVLPPMPPKPVRTTAKKPVAAAAPMKKTVRGR